ncbi:hypothetical protein [Hymenobacter chitinivorans]|uniref:Uncharacterized protein n=1 Tax=Hymenobacter chitinivorans DSM 11115 TaxID=1121954 RepID=A0A2M9BSI0_9BACT|nr:hypothetical protein [Hymenobacter chitinivorans]PJJ60891.1 hypothetical protein CLV45_2326 [Hymenobacter chitinivorans DSM 11115]
MRYLLALALCSFTVLPSEPLLNPSKSLVNAKLPSYTTKQELLRALGPPARIAAVGEECHTSREEAAAKVRQRYYFAGKTSFFLDHDQAELELLDFRSGKYTYQTPTITLTGKTTLADLQKVYPAAVRAASISKRGTEVSLMTCANCDDRVHLFFEQGRLVELELWEPC